MEEEYTMVLSENGGDFTIHDLSTDELLRLQREIIDELERRIEPAPP